jgi:Sporulation inhibitor A
METLPNELLIQAYLKARKQNLDDSFLKMLLDEIIERDIYALIFETGL